MAGHTLCGCPRLQSLVVLVLLALLFSTLVFSFALPRGASWGSSILRREGVKMSVDDGSEETCDAALHWKGAYSAAPTALPASLRVVDEIKLMYYDTTAEEGVSDLASRFFRRASGEIADGSGDAGRTLSDWNEFYLLVSDATWTRVSTVRDPVSHFASSFHSNCLNGDNSLQCPAADASGRVNASAVLDGVARCMQDVQAPQCARFAPLSVTFDAARVPRSAFSFVRRDHLADDWAAVLGRRLAAPVTRRAELAQWAREEFAASALSGSDTAVAALVKGWRAAAKADPTGLEGRLLSRLRCVYAVDYEAFADYIQ